MLIIVRRQFFYALAALVLNLFTQQCETQAELTLGGGMDGLGVAAANGGMHRGVMDAVNINALYDNLLQREYAGPVVFPNHQVERKAQRSPSLRLRFGRRNDPDMPTMPQLSAAKRWFGDVNQKPIRSPSRRLRFGRRSDPSMPLRSSYDALLNDLLLSATYGGSNNNNIYSGQMDNNDLEDMSERNNANDYYDGNDENDNDGFERIVRKPQRLRWGRSIQTKQQQQNRFANMQEAQTEEDAKILSEMMRNENLRNILLNNLGLTDEYQFSDDDNENFDRVVRKPTPLRLRWGRSTGGHVASNEHKEVLNQANEKVESNANAKNSKADKN